MQKETEIMLNWSTFALTDVGCQRSCNEDKCYVSPDRHLFVVTDGMGGTAGGAIASGLAVQVVEELWRASPPDLSAQNSVKEWLENAVAQANGAICRASRKDSKLRGMGTTVVVAVQALQGGLHIVHAGDSRAYLFHDGHTELLTGDHSFVYEMVRSGQLTEAQARQNPYRSVITRCLGHETDVEADYTMANVHPGDWMLLCTDGLSGVLTDEQIGSVLATEDDPQAACAELLKQTIAAGAPDNVTVIAAKYAHE